MNREDFKKTFDKYDGKFGTFSEQDWNNAIDGWKSYLDLIERGLPLDRWLKNDLGYLPDFLDTKEKNFGHARIGNYDQVMIYRYTGKDNSRKGKYIDKYNSRDLYDTTEFIEKDYVDRIQSLLTDLVTAKKVDDVFNLEKDSRYREFSCKQILRKITILMSLMDNSQYKNEFMWFFNKNSLLSLVKILEIDVDDDDTFLKINNKVYTVAKCWSEIDLDDKNQIIKLYSFLLYLSNSSYNLSELESFYNKNLIFNGAPGTGKTYGVLNGVALLNKINSNKFRDSRYIQFHPSFTYQDFIEGIKPLGTKDGNLNLHVVNGAFKDFCIFVKNENEEFYKNNPHAKDEDYPHYYFIVDEINRGNLSNIFGETFTLLENDYRDKDFSGNYTKICNNLVSTPLANVIENLEESEEKSKLIYKEIDGHVLFGIPFNIHFIGIMNDVDRSIDAFDLALRRRFKWIQKNYDEDVIIDRLSQLGFKNEDISDYAESCTNLNNFICSDKANGLKLGNIYQIGHAFFLKISEFASSRKNITKNAKTELFDCYIKGTVIEYIRQVVDETEIDKWIDKAKVAFGIK